MDLAHIVAWLIVGSLVVGVGLAALGWLITGVMALFGGRHRD